VKFKKQLLSLEDFYFFIRAFIISQIAAKDVSESSVAIEGEGSEAKGKERSSNCDTCFNKIRELEGHEEKV
jgi:hypothetical protein